MGDGAQPVRAPMTICRGSGAPLGVRSARMMKTFMVLCMAYPSVTTARSCASPLVGQSLRVAEGDRA